ncbi:MAG TPA: hypothetical protein VJT85_05135 [Gemmatimonadaceae bacterium]|nr:hypothetical protein [Gemmatimonadaceae bacterium]
MRGLRVVAAILALTLACATGGSPDLETSYRDPGVGTLHFRRMLVSYATNDDEARRRVEDKLAKQLPNAFAAYRVAPDLNTRDRPEATKILREKLFDGAVVMRVVDVKDRTTYVPLNTWYTGHPSFYTYWGSSWGMVQRPGYVVNDRVVSVETAIYSIKEDKLVWAARTKTLNATTPAKLVDETVDAVVNHLRGQQLVQ